MWEKLWKSLVFGYLAGSGVTLLWLLFLATDTSFTERFYAWFFFIVCFFGGSVAIDLTRKLPAIIAYCEKWLAEDFAWFIRNLSAKAAYSSMIELEAARNVNKNKHITTRYKSCCILTNPNTFEQIDFPPGDSDSFYVEIAKPHYFWSDLDDKTEWIFSIDNQIQHHINHIKIIPMLSEGRFLGVSEADFQRVRIEHDYKKEPGINVKFLGAVHITCTSKKDVEGGVRRLSFWYSAKDTPASTSVEHELVGEWICDKVKNDKLTITESEAIFSSGGGVPATFRYKIKVNTKKQTYDLAGEGREYWGIYKITGNKLVMNWFSAGVRPLSFDFGNTEVYTRCPKIEPAPTINAEHELIGEWVGEDKNSCDLQITKDQMIYKGGAPFSLIVNVADKSYTLGISYHGNYLIEGDELTLTYFYRGSDYKYTHKYKRKDNPLVGEWVYVKGSGCGWGNYRGLQITKDQMIYKDAGELISDVPYLLTVNTVDKSYTIKNNNAFNRRFVGHSAYNGRYVIEGDKLTLTFSGVGSLQQNVDEYKRKEPSEIEHLSAQGPTPGLEPLSDLVNHLVFGDLQDSMRGPSIFGVKYEQQNWCYPDAPFSLTMNVVDKTYTIKDGTNLYIGSYVIEGDKLTLTQTTKSTKYNDYMCTYEYMRKKESDRKISVVGIEHELVGEWVCDKAENFYFTADLQITKDQFIFKSAKSNAAYDVNMVDKSFQLKLDIIRQDAPLACQIRHRTSKVMRRGPSMKPFGCLVAALLPLHAPTFPPRSFGANAQEEGKLECL